MILNFLVLLACVAVAVGKHYTENKEHQLYAWEAFKADWNKHYDCPEIEALRFNNFIETLKRIDIRNELEAAAGGSAVHGITKFADMTENEFKETLLGSNPKFGGGDGGLNVTFIEGDIQKNTGLVDWTDKYTTPIKNQGRCGSCWAFSATEQIESDAMRIQGDSYILSPEQIVQCDPVGSGCQGGWTQSAFKYIAVTGGIEQESDYPYTSGKGITGKCHLEGAKEVVTVKSFSTIVGPQPEEMMTKYMQRNGPLSVCLAASTWQTYTGGIMHVCDTQVDHCVQAVGVDNGEYGYWKVRNSWGSDWGEAGYIRLAYGANTCDITNNPTYTEVTNL